MADRLYDALLGRAHEHARIFLDTLPSRLINARTTDPATGEIVKEAFPGHVPLGEKAGVWNRGLAPFKLVLEQYWQPYIRGRGTFDEAIAAVLAHLSQ